MASSPSSRAFQRMVLSSRRLFVVSMRQVPRPKNHLDSFRYAVEGIVHVFRTQKHMRFHFFTVVLVLLIALLLRLSRVEMAVLFIVMSGVLVAEMLNTAIESVVDMVTQAYHPLAKLAKDIAAGAVLIASITAAIVGGFLFFGSNKIAQLHVEIKNDPLPVTVIITVVVLVLIIVMISKVLGQKGSILSGGIVSGHSAVSFFSRVHADLPGNGLLYGDTRAAAGVSSGAKPGRGKDTYTAGSHYRRSARDFVHLRHLFRPYLSCSRALTVLLH